MQSQIEIASTGKSNFDPSRQDVLTDTCLFGSILDLADIVIFCLLLQDYEEYLSG